jgi:hypothetical protein
LRIVPDVAVRSKYASMAIFKSFLRKFFGHQLVSLAAGPPPPASVAATGCERANCKILRSKQFAIWVIALRSGGKR